MELTSYNFLLSLTGIICTYLLALLKSRGAFSSEMRYIPTIGPSLPFLSYLGAIRLLFDSSNMLKEGYDKFKHGLFKIPDFRSWTVIASNPQYIEDIRKALPDTLAFEASIDEALHSLGPPTRRSHFHIAIIQHRLTRALNDSLSDIYDELVTTFSDHMSEAGKDDWCRVSAWNISSAVVCRTAHRIFVGHPLCRNKDYISFMTKFAMDISKAATVVRLFPSWLKGFVGRPYVNVPNALKQAVTYLRPLVQERNQNILEFGKHYPGKPQDLLSWFMDDVDGDSEEEKLQHIAFHFLTVNYGAVHTTATSFTHALYHLGAHPEFIKALREEIQMVISEEGWTKSALGRMQKLDSFFKESQRLTGLAAVSTYRRVLKPFTFSDGTLITPGSTIALAAHNVHMDDSIYPDAQMFKPFRFSDSEGDVDHFASPSSNYLPFGLGRHLCPGRFFTIVVMKAMMAHLLLNYDIKLEKDKRPSNSWFILDNVPNQKASVLVKKLSRTDL